VSAEQPLSVIMAVLQRFNALVSVTENKVSYSPEFGLSIGGDIAGFAEHDDVVTLIVKSAATDLPTVVVYDSDRVKFSDESVAEFRSLGIELRPTKTSVDTLQPQQ
jgi:hypothetical protein